MIYYKNSRAVKPNRRQVEISTFAGINTAISESILPIKYSPLSYNFLYGNGALNTGMGYREAKLPIQGNNTITHILPTSTVKLLGIWLYRRYDIEDECRDDRIIVKGENGTFYETKLFDLDTYHPIGNITTSGKVNMANYRLNGQDVLLVSSEYGKLWIYDGINAPYMVENSPQITSMAVHYERIFATTGGEMNQVWFSDDFDPSNWNVSMTEGGFIEFSDGMGRANRVVSYLDHIYIFRDYGINRLTAYGDQSEFAMVNLFVSAGRIYPDTVAVCGDKVIFLAEDGLYALDGVTTSRILENINPLLTGIKDYSKGCFYNGKYYLATNINYNDGVKVLSEKEINSRNNSVLEFNINTSVVNIMRGVDVYDFLPFNVDNASGLLSIFRKLKTYDVGMLDYTGAFFDTSLPKYWRTAVSDLAVFGKQKNIRDLYINSAYDIKVGLIVDNKEHEYSVRGSYNTSKVKVDIKGNMIAFVVKTNCNDAEIKNLSVIIDIV